MTEARRREIERQIRDYEIVWNRLRRDPDRFMTVFKNTLRPGANVVRVGSDSRQLELPL